MRALQTRTARGITFAYIHKPKPGIYESRLEQIKTGLAAGGPLILRPSAQRGVSTMIYKVLGLLLCIGVMSLVSGCYCYPPGYHPHPHRYSSAPPYQSYAHHAWGPRGIQIRPTSIGLETVSHTRHGRITARTQDTEWVHAKLNRPCSCSVLK